MKSVTKFLFRRRVYLPSTGVLLVAVVVGALFWFQPRFLLRELAERNPEVLFYVETEAKVLALTIDDAPDSFLTPLILDMLAEHQVKATFFVLGQHIKGNEEIIARMKAEGHELGNHLTRDEATILLTDEEFAQQLREVAAKIGPFGETRWCRPGSGWFSPDMVQIAHDQGYRCCLGSIYPFDNKLRKPELIRSMVMDRVFPGAIIVLHDGGPERGYVVPLLDELLPELKAAGYEFLTLSEIQAFDQR
ncbi:MAG: polysaccharide deacetylase family protein [Candidatus Krumholzibacteria bacterium]|nr:polysaccharide deacetylase family protein [Candidatus Krumholzibacteria bacterium]